MSVPIIATHDQLTKLVELAFGPAALAGDLVGRYRDTARDMVRGTVPAPNPETESFLASLQLEADEAEERRVAEVRRVRQETADRWSDFDQKRAAPSATPEGFRDLSVRDESTGKLIKLRIPADFVLSA